MIETKNICKFQGKVMKLKIDTTPCASNSKIYIKNINEEEQNFNFINVGECKGPYVLNSNNFPVGEEVILFYDYNLVNGVYKTDNFNYEKISIEPFFRDILVSEIEECSIKKEVHETKEYFLPIIGTLLLLFICLVIVIWKKKRK